jgi:uncharacterized protein (TIGR03067 family)
MRTALGWLSLLFCSTVLAGPQEYQAKKDLEKIQGKWKIETEVIEGEKTPAKLLAKASITFKGKTLIWEPKADNPAIKIKLDPSKKPPAIDLIDGKDIAFGIYQLDGDTLTICWEDFNSGRPRPEAFKATKENRYLVLRREKKER